MDGGPGPGLESGTVTIFSPLDLGSLQFAEHFQGQASMAIGIDTMRQYWNETHQLAGLAADVVSRRPNSNLAGYGSSDFLMGQESPFTPRWRSIERPAMPGWSRLIWLISTR